MTGERQERERQTDRQTEKEREGREGEKGQGKRDKQRQTLISEYFGRCQCSIVIASISLSYCFVIII